MTSRFITYVVKYSYQLPYYSSTDHGVYKQWSEWRMEKAMEAASQGKVSVCRAALQFNVPKSTQGDRVSRWVQAGTVSGPAKYLTDKEEENLATLLSCCGVIGYVRSKAEVLSLVQHILESRGKHVSVSYGWWASFQQHHPELVSRNPAPLSQAIRKPQIPKKHWLLTNSKVNLAKFLTWMSPGSHWMQRCPSLFMQG